jgi:microcystin-dependent protein
MISLIVPVVKPTISMVGTIRYLSYPQVTKPWMPLSGGYVPALDNPELLNILGFKYGQTTIDDVLHFKLPAWNQINASALSLYPRPWNPNNSNGRNIGKSVLQEVSSALQAHTHTGSSSSDGAHTHAPSSGGRFAGGIKNAHAGGGGMYPADWGQFPGSAGHGAHDHSGGVSGGMILDGAHSSPNVEPKGYGAILCIHLG